MKCQCHVRLRAVLMPILFLGILCGVSRAGNLVVNGDAESGDLSGWVTTNGMEVLSDLGATSRGTLGLGMGADVGDYSFHGGQGPTPATATQTIDLAPYALDIDAGNQIFELGVALQSRSANGPFDSAIARFTFFDASASAIGNSLDFTDSPLPANIFTWTEFSQQGLVPIGTRSLGIEIESNRMAGSSSDAYIDNVSFELVPEPSSFLLFFSAVSMIAVVRRRGLFGQIVGRP